MTGPIRKARCAVRPGTLLLAMLLAAAAVPGPRGPAAATSAPAPAGDAAGLDAELEARLPALVGRMPGSGSFEVDWERPLPADAAILAVRYDAKERVVTARLAEPAAEPKRLVTLRGRVRLVASVPTPAAPIEAGRIVAAVDLGAVEIDLLGGHPELVQEAALVVDRTARRALEPGRPILARDLRQAPAVGRSDLVTITARSGKVAVRGRVKALEAGQVGEVIRVQNQESRKVITATIIAPGAVEVRP